RAVVLEVERPAQGRVACHEGEVQLGRAARRRAARGPYRSGRDPGSRCTALVAAAVPQGTVVLHAGHTGHSHPATVPFRLVGTGSRLTITTQRNREESPFSAAIHPKRGEVMFENADLIHRYSRADALRD